MESNFNLHCLVLGDDPSRIFMIKVASTESVSAFKDLMKARRTPRFDDVPAERLDLWDVDLPVDDALQRCIDDLELGRKAPLSPASVAKLFKVFSDLPKKKHLHIVVRRPPITVHPSISLNCLVLGDDPSRIFTVKVASTESVSAFRDLIKAWRTPRFDDVPADHLDLWDVDLPVDDDLQRCIDGLELDRKAPLSPVAEMFELFSDPPKDKHLHFIVRRPPPDIPYPDAQLDSRDAYLNHTIGRPSSAAIPSTFADIQDDKARQFLCNRPRGVTDSVPVILLQRIFAEFVDDCENYRPTAVDNAFVQKLSDKMSSFYYIEDKRMFDFRQLLTGYGIPLDNTTIGETQYTTDGHMMLSHRFIALLITEGKGEIGSGNVEPFAQVLAYYRAFLEEGRRLNPIPQPQSLFPCFQIVVFGACFGICGSIFPSKIQSDVLVPIIPLFYHPTDLPMQAMAARALGSLKIAIDKLKTLYDTPLLSFNPGDEFILRCPYPRSYTDSTKHMHGFSYEKTQALRSHLIFFGTVNDETRSKICIKFVRRYSPEAHRFCAARGYAPKLIAYERLPGGWNMVIMDFLEIVQYPYLQRPGTYRQLRNMTYEDRLSLEKPITSFIHDLHEGGFVHGDIRDTNLFAGLDGKFMLLDFDWAGPITRTFYPMHVNRYDIYRPDGAEDGMEITVDHDLEMLLHVFHGMAAKRRRILSPAEESPPVEELPMDI